MKSLLLTAAVAALAFTGCATEDTPVGPTPPQGISVNFSTSITTVSRATPVEGTDFAADAEIAVFGTETKSGGTANATWMNNVKLTKNAENNWIYTDAKNFMKGYEYSFVAYAPYRATPLTMTDLTKVPYAVSGDMAKQEDFMYVATVAKNYSTAAPASGDQVALAFKHALSQVKFSAQTSADYSAYYDVKITSIELATIVSAGTLNFTNGTWTLDEATTDTYTQAVSASVGVLAGNAVKNLDSDSGTLMLLPQSPKGKDLVLTLEVTAKAGGDTGVAAGATSVTVKFPANDPAWEAGHAYTYKINLNLDETLGWSVAGFSKPTITDWIAEPVRPIE